MMTQPILLLILLLLSLSLQAAERIRVVGSTTVLPVVAEAAKQFRQQHPDVLLTVSGGGSGVGVASLGQGTAEIGMASRQLTAREKQRLADRAEVVAIARDAVAVAVSKAVYQSGVKALTLAQVAAIYRGEINNWKGLGGADKPILVIDKESSRGTRHVFAEVVLGNAYTRAPGAAIISGSNNEEQAIIAGSDKAIGMLSNAWLNDAVRAVAILDDQRKILPSLENITDGRYPISRDLNLLVGKDGNARVHQFIAFLLSPQGQQIVQQTCYLPVR